MKTENGAEGTAVTLWVDSLPVLGKWLVESAYTYEIVQPEELRAAAHQYALEKADSYRQRAEALK